MIEENQNVNIEIFKSLIKGKQVVLAKGITSVLVFEYQSIARVKLL